MPTVDQLWRFLPWGYLLTVALETPVLMAGLSARHSWKRRLFAGFWLTACSYPIVILVLPVLLWEPYGRTPYLVVAEIFAPLSECLLFYVAFDRMENTPRKEVLRNAAVIIAANVFSFLAGEFWFGN